MNSSLIILIFVIIAAGCMSWLFSGAETGIYQLSRLRLRIGIEKKKPLSLVLGDILQDSPGLLISILVGNNLANYIITSCVTYILLGRMEEERNVELLATLITAPTIFVFAELIPKNVFFYRADVLMPYIAPVLFFFKKVFTFTGITPLLRMVSALLTRLTPSKTHRDTAKSIVREPYIKAIVQDTHEEGLLGHVQRDMINRLAGISAVSVRSVMTRLDKIQALDINSDRRNLLDRLKSSQFTRLPVYERYIENITGFVNIYECLHSGQDFTSLRDFVRPIKRIADHTTVIDAINTMQRRKEKIMLVVQTTAREKPLGIVTMKDLVEEMLGELVQW